MCTVDSIKKGFVVATKNPALIMVLFIFNLIWNMINVAIMPAPAATAPGATTPPAVPPETALLTFMITIAFVLVSIFMQGGSLGLVRDYVKGNKMSLGKFASYGLKYYLRLLGVGIIIILLIVIAALIAGLIIAAVAPLNNVVATVIATLIAIAVGLFGIYLVIRLVMSPYALVCDEAGVMDAMKHSMNVVRRKYFWKVLLLLVLIVLIAIGIGVLVGIVTGLVTVAMPPKAGQVVIGVVNSLFNGYLGIVMMAAFLSYYLTLQEKIKSGE
ncbi:MAG: hypothetical protein WC404_00795 [Candidatus Omnitrophota bacterium]|jgi:hypothetical protein